MGFSSRGNDDHVYRLVGDMEGVHREFILEPGEHRVGSLPENEVSVAASDVSRRHAVIRVNANSVHLEDLKSTNGTFVNGVQVTRSDLAPDDWIQFGSVLLTLERVDRGDLALGIASDSENSNSEAGAERTEHTTQLGRTRDRYARWHALANSVADMLFGDRSSNPGPTLERFREGLNATAVAVLRLERGTEATVHAISGHAETIDGSRIDTAIERLRFENPGTFAGAYLEEPSPLIVVARSAGPDDLDALVITGGDLDQDLVPICELVLRILLHAGPVVQDEDLATTHLEPEPLVFPAGHVRGVSSASLAVYEKLQALRTSTTPVLIIGETGVGKEHVVQILHASSDRADGPLRVINCAAIPAELLEAELFGIEAGVATGVAGRKGAFREADGGTLFFDEIGAMPLALQAKLLRALQENEVHPVGARHPVPVDVRIVEATNLDLTAAIKNETFRSDLYYRIAGCEINVAPLRKRRDDIPALVRVFLESHTTESGKRIRGLSVSALTRLQNAAWPGNVRQLEHEVRRLVSICPDGATIESPMISPEITAASPLDDEIADDDLTLKHHVDALERQLLRRAINRANGNLARAARLLGLSRNGLVMKMQRLNIDKG